MEWIIHPFNQLTTAQLYDILKIRCEVFIVEQNCPYPDLDGLDRDAVHIFAVEDGMMVAYCRILPPGVKYKEASIGRVVTDKNYRGTGLGRELIRRAIHFAATEMDNKDIRISAQAYLIKFYESFGFQVVSQEYLEDDIPHVEMYYNGMQPTG